MQGPRRGVFLVSEVPLYAWDGHTVDYGPFIKSQLASRK